MEKKKKKKSSINPFVILFMVMLVCVVASYFIAPGAFERTEENGRTIVVEGSFHEVERTPVSIGNFFLSIPQGLTGAASIMFLVMLVGGFVQIYLDTGALDKGISKILRASDKFGSPVVLVIIMLLFSAIGGFLGWAEQIIPFVPIIVSICIALGYDAIVGMASSAFVCMMGFAVSPTNVYTVGISHEIAELPMFSGMWLRLIALVVVETVIMIYILVYAARVKKDPTKSIVYGIDNSSLKRDYSSLKDSRMTRNQILVLLIFGITFAAAIFGVLNYGWEMDQLSAVFLAGGLAGGLVGRLGVNGVTTSIINGARGALDGALVIGLARAIQVVMTQGGLIDPIIHFLSKSLNGLSPWLAATGIFLVTILADGLIPSGSGKAIAIMPILIPLADMIGITRQTATLAYQFGDGFANMYWFTNGTLLIFLAVSKVPLRKWYKFLWPLQIVLTVIAVVFLGIAIAANYQ
ncbi:YfcC family protein [Novisyntrophococcus fermenticellae]|uniref:YfcC family protein n=1 Tax=Novisyntrophococcus fermenticellae TaxID=2068655 RepID=UPI001E305F48|nr:YfcC family protein [Novisyntrophococcus fermenticellae]